MLEQIRKDFPILSRTVYDKPLVYLDNAATTLKPQAVIDALNTHYAHETSNVHRGIHFLSNLATEKYENARKKVAHFIGAKSENEIVFTRGTTDSINLVALSYARKFLNEGDRIVCTEMEHHSNMVPWQMLAQEKKLDLVYIPILDSGELDMKQAEELINEKTKLLTFNWVSNSLGTVNDVEQLIAFAKKVDAKVLIDAAQAVLHFPLDVAKLDVDFLAFSSHKMLGATGLGVLFAKAELLESMPPIQGGGDMIEEVRLEGSTWNQVPFRFEAGTPHIAGVIALAAAIDYIQSLGFTFIQEQEKKLLSYAKEKLSDIHDIRIYGNAKNKVPIFAFTVEGLHGTDLATLIDQEGIAVRSGHHCTMPVLQKYNVPSLARASFAFYNSENEVDSLVSALKKAVEMLK